MAKRVDTLGITEHVLRTGTCIMVRERDFFWTLDDDTVEVRNLGANAVLVLVHKNVRRLVWKGCLKWFWTARRMPDGKKRRELWLGANRLARLYKKDLEEEN
jgi:hypothetical protein